MFFRNHFNPVIILNEKLVSQHKSNGVRPRRALLLGPLGPASRHDRTSTEQTTLKTLRPRMSRLRPTCSSRARRRLGSFYARWHPGCKDFRFPSTRRNFIPIFRPSLLTQASGLPRTTRTIRVLLTRGTILEIALFTQQ